MWKDKIIAAIKAKYPAINLSKTRLDAIAAILDGKVTDDSSIDAIIETFNEYSPLAEIAKQDDTVRNLQTQLAKKPKTDTPPADQPPADEPGKEKPPAEEMPAWAKTLLETVNVLAGEKKQNQIQDELNKRLKEIPVKFWNKRALPTDLDGLEDFVKEVETDYTEFTQETTDKTVSRVPRPAGGNGKSGGTNKQATKEELDAVAKELHI